MKKGWRWTENGDEVQLNTASFSQEEGKNSNFSFLFLFLFSFLSLSFSLIGWPGRSIWQCGGTRRRRCCCSCCAISSRASCRRSSSALPSTMSSTCGSCCVLWASCARTCHLLRCVSATLMLVPRPFSSPAFCRSRTFVMTAAPPGGKNTKQKKIKLLSMSALSRNLSNTFEFFRELS